MNIKERLLAEKAQRIAAIDLAEADAARLPEWATKRISGMLRYLAAQDKAIVRTIDAMVSEIEDRERHGDIIPDLL